MSCSIQRLAALTDYEFLPKRKTATDCSTPFGITTYVTIHVGNEDVSTAAISLFPVVHLSLRVNTEENVMSVAVKSFPMPEPYIGDELLASTIEAWCKSSKAKRLAQDLHVNSPFDFIGSVYLYLYRRLSDGAKVRDLKRWVFGNASGAFRNAASSDRLHEKHAEPDQPEARISGDEITDEERRRLFLIDDALARLPERLRQPLLVKFGADIDLHTIADLSRHSGTPESTLKDRVRQGFRKIKQMENIARELQCRA